MLAGWQIPTNLTTTVQGFTTAQAQGLIPTPDEYWSNALDLARQQHEGEYQDVVAQIQAQMAALNKELEQIDPAYRDAEGLINERQALNDLREEQAKGSFADQQKVFKARAALMAAQGESYQLQREQLRARMGEFRQLTAALDNIQNQADVARGLQQQAVGDRRMAAGGLQAIDVAAPLTGNAPALPPGVRYAIETDAQRLGRQFARTEQERGFATERAGINTGLAGLRLGEQELGAARGDAARSRDLALATSGLSRAGLQVDMNNLSRDRALSQAQGLSSQTQLTGRLNDATRRYRLGLITPGYGLL